MSPVTHRPTPLTVYLPFNRDCLRGHFAPAKSGVAPPRTGDTGSSSRTRRSWSSRRGSFPPARGGAAARPRRRRERADLARHSRGHALLGDELAKGAPVPPALARETLVPMQGTRLPDELLSLGGMAMQLLWWESTSGHCPRCGEPTVRIQGEWGKQCPRCRYEHYPHLHPPSSPSSATASRVLLARKAGWAPGRYALVAGFVDNGESLEGAVAREVKEEVGVDVTDVQYVGSQNWPFPSQLMIGFVARYAGGEIAIDKEELEDARWFDCDKLPTGPSRHSIAGFIIANHARP